MIKSMFGRLRGRVHESNADEFDRAIAPSPMVFKKFRRVSFEFFINIILSSFLVGTVNYGDFGDG